MKVFKPIGSKDRLVEMFQNVNKVKLNEGLFEAGSPNLNADNVLNMAFNQLKNNALNIEHSNTQATGEENFVELICTDRQGNNITFVFKVQSTEGDQEGVYNVNNVSLNTFSFDSADGEETIDLAEDGLKRFNQQYSKELFDVIDKYIDVEEPAVQEAIDLIDAIKQDSYPFGGSPDDMQTGSGYADQKPTNDSVRVKSPELDQFIQEGDMNTSFIYSVSNSLKESGVQMLDIIDKPEINTIIFKLKYKGKLYNVSVKKEEIDSIDNVSETLKNKLGITGVSEILQTGKNYADQKPTNDSVRVKSPELDQFIQEDMAVPTKIRTVDELKAYREQLKAQGFKGIRKEDIPLLADQALYDMAVKLADRMLPMGWDGLADVNSMWDYIRKDGGMTFDQLVKSVKKAVNVRLKEEGYSLKSLGLGENNLQELDKPAMRLIQQAPGGASAGGVKQLEEKMTKPIVGGVSASISEDMIGEPKPINPSTKSPVDDLPPEKKKIIMDAINSLTKHKPDFAPSADQINTEILRLRNQPPAVKEEGGELEDTDAELKRFYKEKELATQHPEQISTMELEPEEEPIPEVSPEKKAIIMQAGDNLTARNARNPNYSPTINEILDEIDRIEGKKKPIKKFRGASKEGEFYLSEISNLSTANTAKMGTQAIFDKIDPNSNVKKQIIQGASEFADMHLGVKRFQMSPEEYKNFVKEIALTMYVDYLGYTRQNEALNEEEEKSDYPDPIGKKFKPKPHYPKKKKKKDTIVKLTEDIYSDDDIETPDLPIDTAVRRARGAERQATSDTNKEFGRQIDPQTEFQPELAEEQDQTGEQLLAKEFENLKQNETFQFLSDAYISLLGLSREFRDDKKIQVSLANIRDSIVEYLNMAEMPVTQQGVQDYFENNLTESLYEDKEPGAEIPETDPDETGPDVTPDETSTDDGMSLEPQGDEIAQLAQDKEEVGDEIPGGKAEGKSPLEYDPEQISMGVKIEMEHTDDPMKAVEIAMDHLEEFPDYYTRLDKMEKDAKAELGGEEKSLDANDDKEMTDMLLGYKPHNVGDEVEEPKVDEMTSVSDEKGFAKEITTTPRPETGMVKEDLGFSEKDLKDRDPATWHQIQIAKKTLKMPAAMANVMGGMSKEEAKEILRKRGIKFDDK